MYIYIYNSYNLTIQISYALENLHFSFWCLVVILATERRLGTDVAAEAADATRDVDGDLEILAARVARDVDLKDSG